MTDSSQPFDLFTIGRIEVDLYALRSGVPLGDVQKFGKFPEGSAGQVSAATARPGHPATAPDRDQHAPVPQGPAPPVR
ncbi:hypothetical protein [Streptomyces sp. NPDC020489]|uniref:hypothetical protein n=1 Tax=Streptomyces sp. NPDC020489 TaxID=3365077 RepID=UPI0037B11ECF